ncbi:MAG: two-component regulator propeller domain-containing protein [Saprospiraceae bacterium]
MNNLFRSISLILILTLNYSCIGKKSSDNEMSNLEIVKHSEKNTLKFTSGIRSIYQDNNGNYWLGSHKEGVSYYDGKSFRYFTKKDGLADNQIRSIKGDTSGNVWFGTANGVSVYNGKKFTSYSTKISDPKSKWNTTIGNLWFNAGKSEGVNRYDGKNMNYLIFPKPKSESIDDSYGVTDISKDKEGNVWIGTYAMLFNFDGNELNVFNNNKLKLNDGEKLHIRSVFADSQGRIWVGNNGIGVLLLENNSTINFTKKNGLIHNSNFNNSYTSPTGTLERVFVIEEDAEGNIWFGDRDSGAWKFDGKTITNYTIDSKLTSPMIWCIYNDNTNNLLFGMADGGVYKFNGKSFDKMF